MEQKIEGDPGRTERKQSSNAKHPALDLRAELIAGAHEQGVRKIEPLLAYALKDGAQSGCVVRGLKAGRTQVPKDRVIPGRVRMVDGCNRGPDQLCDRQGIRNRDLNRRRLNLTSRLRSGLPVSGDPRPQSRYRKNHKRTGRGTEPRPAFLTEVDAYHAIWKPARAPTSPVFKPTPTPAETADISPTRAEKAAVAAVRFS